MKRTTQMISLLLCIVMVLGLLPMQAFAADIVASGYCGGEGDGTNLTWTLDGDGLLTISGTGAMADYNNYWGQNLAPWGNYRTTIKGLILGEGITHIGNNAFHVLENLSGTLELPSSVVSIGTNAFRACALTGSLTIPNNTETIGGWAFCGCSHLDGTLTLGKNLTKVYDNAFEDTNFTKIDIGSCTSDALIGKLIPALLDTLNEISVDPANPNYLLQDGILYNRAITEIVFCSRSRTGTLEIPNGVEIISDYAFFRCADLTGELKFPDTLTRIGDTAFCKCTGFTGDLRFPDTVSYIGHSAFSECTGFDGQLFLPKGVTLGERVFNYCQGLRGSIVIPEGVSVVPASAFFECSGFDGNIILGSDVKKIDAFAFKCCKNVTGSLDIPAGVTHIGVCAFEYCNALNGSAFLPADFHVASWAFKCGIKNFYFRGNAPTGDGLRHYTFPDDATLYYLENTSGWTDSDAYDAKAGTWYGYKLEIWDNGSGGGYEIVEEYLSVDINNVGSTYFVGDEIRMFIQDCEITSDDSLRWTFPKGINLSISDSSIVSLKKIEEYDNFAECRFVANKTGMTVISIADERFKEPIKIALNVTEDKYKSCRADKLPIYEYKLLLEKDYYNAYVDGVYVSDFTYRANQNGTYTFEFNAYNEKYTLGVVEVYNSAGEIVEIEVISKFSDPSSLKQVAYGGIDMIVDAWNGDTFSFRGVSSTKMTHVCVDVPKDGFILVTNSCASSNSCFFVNLLDFFLTAASFIESTAKFDIKTVDPDFERIMKNAGVGYAFSTVQSVIMKGGGPAGVALSAIFQVQKGLNLLQQTRDFTRSANSVSSLGIFPPYNNDRQFTEITSKDGIRVSSKQPFESKVILQTYKIVNYSGIANEVITSKDCDYELYDISLIKDGIEIQPMQPVTVCIPMPGNYSLVSLYKQEANGKWDRINFNVHDGIIEFKVSHFCPFVLILDPNKEVTIDFNSNGGIMTTTTAITNADGTLDTLPTPTRDGYTFTGWFTAADGGTQITKETVFTEDTIVYAHWNAHTHNMTHTEAKQATCTENGNLEYWYCTKCEKYYLDADGNLETTLAAVTTTKLSHDYVATVTDPTCTEKGYTTHTCLRCDVSYVDTYVDALGHDWGEWTEKIPTTETVAGEELRVCSRCKTEDSRVIPALGHTHNMTHTEAKQAACTEDGNLEYWYCTECEKYYLDADGKLETTLAEVNTTKLGHNYDAAVTDPTCTKKGYTTHTCSRCDVSYVDTYVDALGHNLIHHDGKAADCETLGWNAYDTCSRCDYSTYAEIPASHKPGNIVIENKVEPTQTANGFYDEVVYCTVCGEELQREMRILDKLRADSPQSPTDEPIDGKLPFIDVTKTDWFYEDVKYVNEHDLMNGTASNLFSPGVTTTRGIIVTILYRLEGEPTTAYTGRFSDVAEGEWYTNAIEWAASRGIVNGFDDGRFGPNDPITREQLVTILYRYAKASGMDVPARENLGAFTDSTEVSSYALDAMRWAVAEGLISGSGSKLLPCAQATRAQVAAILHRFCGAFVR